MLAAGYRGDFELRGASAPAASATEAKGEAGNSHTSSANRRKVSKPNHSPKGQ